MCMPVAASSGNRSMHAYVYLLSLVADFEISVDAEFVNITDDSHICNSILWSGACSKERRKPAVLYAATPPTAMQRV